MRSTLLAGLLASALALILTACGGGDGDDGPAAIATPTTISGAVVKGPVGGATVTVKNAASGAVLGTATTSVAGTYTVNVSFTGDVVVEVTGGNYEDEATGNTTALATTMRVVLTLNGSAVTGHVTPLTSMAYTYSVGTGGAVTSTRFNAVATALASQFQLNGVNLATTLPDLDLNNAYAKALRALSEYLDAEGVTLNDLINDALDTAGWASFSTAYSSAYAGANGGNVTFTFDGDAINIAGTGGGGGSGTCGVHMSGSVSTGGMTVPLNLDYCITGIAGGSCSAENSTLNQALSGQGGATGVANLTYSYSSSCAPGAITINLL